MKFKRVLHPEIILDKRGDSYIRTMYRELLRSTRMRGALTIGTDDPRIAEFLQHDVNFRMHLGHCHLYVNDPNAQCFHLGKDFTQALAKIDRDIPIDILPKNFVCYISFAEGSLSDEDGDIQGGYVSISSEANRVLSMSYINTRMINNAFPVTTITAPLKQAKIDEMFKDVPIKDIGCGKNASAVELSNRNNVFRALLNAVVYLYSQEPLIEKTRPVKEIGLSNKEILRRGQVLNECTIPVYFLNRSYHRVYTKDKTWVDSFLRWQRCGPQLSQVRLIMVSAHERTYKSNPIFSKSVKGIRGVGRVYVNPSVNDIKALLEDKLSHFDDLIYIRGVICSGKIYAWPGELLHDEVIKVSGLDAAKCEHFEIRYEHGVFSGVAESDYAANIVDGLIAEIVK